MRTRAQIRITSAALLWLALVPTALVSAGEVAVLRNGFTIRHEHRAVVGANTRLYLDGDTSSYVDIPTAEIQGFEKDAARPSRLSQPASPAQAAPQSTADLGQVVSSASASFHLDPDLVNSVIHAESGFNSRAVSRKGAQGLMQLMPGTANKLGVSNPFDAQANVTGGSRYLRELLERYNFDLVKALAAYNAGPERVEQYRGVPPYRETQAYVARIVREYNRKKIAQEHQTGANKKTKSAQKSPSQTTSTQP